MDKCTKLLISVIVASLMATHAPAGDASPQLRKSELRKHTFVVGSLKITVTKFSSKVIFGDTEDIGTGQLGLKVENTSSQFVTFSPHLIALVGHDNNQVSILDVRHDYKTYVPAAEIKIARGASIKEIYRLKRPVQLPARLYYDNTLLTVITD